MKSYELPSKTLLLWRIRLIIVTLLLSLLAMYFCPLFVYLYAVPVLLGAICIIGVAWYLPNYFKYCKISLINKSVVIENGVFIRTTHIMPYERLIYTQTLSSPVAKALNLSAISLKAARSRILVPEMEVEKVDEFLQKITGGDSDK